MIKYFHSLYPQPQGISAEVFCYNGDNLKLAERLAATCLQGLVNRNGAKIYIAYGRENDPFIRIYEKAGIRFIDKGDVNNLFTDFSDFYHGAVVYNPALHGTITLAIVTGALDNLLPVTAELANQRELQVVYDYSRKFSQNIDAYQYGLKNYMPRCLKSVAAFFHLYREPETTELKTSAWAPPFASADYLVAHHIYPLMNTYAVPDADFRSGCLRVSETSSEPELIALYEDWLKTYYRPNSPVITGFTTAYGEHSGVAFLSEFALFAIPDPGVNLSFHSAFKLKEPLKQKRKPAATFNPAKKYLAMIGSDGDNLGAMRAILENNWNVAGRGGVPFCQDISTAISLLMPKVIEYFYETATENDYFVGGCSGIGYTKPRFWAKAYPADQRQEIWREFCRLNSVALKLLDMHEFWPLNTDEKTRYTMTQYHSGLQALFVDFTPADKYAEANQIINDVPVFRCLVGPWASETPGDSSFTKPDVIAKELSQKTANEPGAIVFAGINGWLAKPDLLREIVSNLTDFEIIPAYHLAGLLRESYAKY